MSDHDLIAALTRKAFLNAIILSLLTIQFILPFAFVIFLWLIPPIFALEVEKNSWHLTLLSGLALLTLGLFLFGVYDSLWLALYILMGLIAGIGRRFHFHWLVRLGFTSLSFTLLLLTLILLFSRIAQLDWQQVQQSMGQIALFQTLPLLPVLVVGIISWMIAVAAAVEWFLSRVSQNLALDQEGDYRGAL
ncbi:MAG: hypothetical protein H0T73_03825 [Ardenticatenales bacterium]|nr:hypothetical protein [Ardenticatenales bacterium]